MNGVVGAQPMGTYELGRVLDGVVGQLDSLEAWRAVGCPPVIAREGTSQEQRIVEVELAHAVLAPERGGDLHAREHRDEERRGQPPDRLVPVLGDIQLDERGGVGEDAQPRSSMMIEESVRPRAARLPAAATAAGSGRG